VAQNLGQPLYNFRSWHIVRGARLPRENGFENACCMIISRLLVLVSGFGGDFGLVHTTLVAVSGCFRVFQDDLFQGLRVSRDNGHGRVKLGSKAHALASQ
jgi:hypothetical protein